MAENAALIRADGALLRVTDNGVLTRAGVPHRIMSGSMHYFRVHPGQWRDRLRRLVDMGLNTLDTYVAWNFHQPQEGRPATFDGWCDVEGFIGMAGEEGLDVIVRPGPYICAEWSNGGLPSWLTRRTASENGVGRRPLVPRSSDPGFTRRVARWFDDLIPRIAALQACHGGPVVAVQVENEYGSYGDDAAYLTWLRTALVERGVTELLFTADGPTELMLDGGTLDGTLAAVTLGSGARAARELQQSRRPGEPFLAAEFWDGWFDHWGEKHHVRSADSATAALSEILDAGSVSIYMAHGGTNFGLWAGSNEDNGKIQPTVTSYDSDAPIAEDGRLTPKFHAFRELLGATGPLLSTEPRFLPETSVPLTPAAGLLPGLMANGIPTPRTPAPASFEQLRLDAGISVHRARPVLPHGPVTLRITDLADRAVVFVDGERVGALEGPGQITVEGHGRRVDLLLIVEAYGRINYGPLLGAPKGLLGPVMVERRMIHGWWNRAVPLQDWGDLELARAMAAGDDVNNEGTGFATASWSVEEPADTHLMLPGSGRGYCWINGFLLGRYDERGPQCSLYCPAPLLHPGSNTVTVLETEHLGDSVEMRQHPDLGPTEEYIEQF